METLCPRINHKRKAEGNNLRDVHRACKAAKLEAQRAASYTYFSLLWREWLSRDLNKQDASNFQHSGAPLCFMYTERGQWRNYTKEVTNSLMVHFAAGKNSARFSVSGKVYLVDFEHMLQLNTQTGSVRSVAWTDQTGKCLAPSKCLEGHIQDFFCVRPDPLDDGFTCHTSPGVGPSHDFAQLGDKLAKVPEHDQEFTFVKETFLGGFSYLAKHVIVMGVYRSSYTGSLGQVRLQTFKGQEQATREARGDANVQYAWHGTSKNGVSGILQHGFGQPRVPKHGVVYGVGVYLAPKNCSHISAMYSDVDENGEQHMLLCKVIMGRTEQVYLASEQFHPSNEEYDTGVDDVGDPKRYIVWSTHMNTHILPQFVVSFKLKPSLRAAMLAGGQRRNQMLRSPLSSQPSGNALCGTKDMELLTKAKATCILSPNKPLAGTCTERDSLKACSCTSAKKGSIFSTVVDSHKSPRSSWISISDLLSLVEPKLNGTALSTLQKLYCEFQIGRLPRVSLVKMIRCVVGDSILRECLDSNTVQPARSCSTQALCMDKDCQSSAPTQRCT